MQISMVERLSGKKDKNAKEISSEIIKDVQIATAYPPEDVDKITTQELSELVNNLVGDITKARDKAESSSGGFDDI